MSLNIRHILPANNLYAVYFLDKPPYAAILKCVHQASVSRPAIDAENDTSEHIHEIIGFVIDNHIVPADETSEGTTFAWYVDRSEFDDASWKKYMQDVLTWGTQMYQQRHPEPPPPAVTDLAIQTPQRRKRRARVQPQ